MSTYVNDEMFASISSPDLMELLLMSKCVIFFEDNVAGIVPDNEFCDTTTVCIFGKVGSGDKSPRILHRCAYTACDF